MNYTTKILLFIVVCILPLRGVWYDVCIDPGHCGDADPGAPGVNGSAEPDESDFNLGEDGVSPPLSTLIDKSAKSVC